MSCDTCCASLLRNLVRSLTFLLTLLGGGVAALGGYLWYKLTHGDIHTAPNILSTCLLAVGVTLFVMSLSMALCGYKSRCFMKMYMLVLGVLLVGQAMLACFCLIPDAREKLMHTMASEAGYPESEINEYIKEHGDQVMYGGYGLVGVFAIELFTIILLQCQRRRLDREEDGELSDSDDDDEESGRKKALIPKRQVAMSRRRDDEEDAARSRYRDKYREYYDKYGVSSRQ